MKAAYIRRIFHIALTLVFFCALGRADIGDAAPMFTLRTLDGETFTNASLRGRAVLLQFWATRCPECREDQSAVDDLEQTFSGQGLVVLAVDVGDSEAAVKKYLREHPRACRIVLDRGASLGKRFGRRGNPYYVAIDREGRIAGTQSGAGGEELLLDLVKRAALPPRAKAQPAGDQSPAVPRGPSGAKVIEVPQVKNSRPSKPIPKTIFVLTSGERLESSRYTIGPRYLHVVVGGEERTIAVAALDLKATAAANQGRGVDLKIPKNGSEVFVAF